MRGSRREEQEKTKPCVCVMLLWLQNAKRHAEGDVGYRLKTMRNGRNFWNEIKENEFLNMNKLITGRKDMGKKLDRCSWSAIFLLFLHPLVSLPLAIFFQEKGDN